jgi:hypothetical protein
MRTYGKARLSIQLKTKKIFENADSLRKTEMHYQNQLLIDAFLKSHIPTVFAKADFIGDRDGRDAKVTWTITKQVGRS